MEAFGIWCSWSRAQVRVEGPREGGAFLHGSRKRVIGWEEDGLEGGGQRKPRLGAEEQRL